MAVYKNLKPTTILFLTVPVPVPGDDNPGNLDHNRDVEFGGWEKEEKDV